MRILRLLTFALPLLYSPFSFSQSNLSLCREKNLVFEKQLNSVDCSIHTSIRPFIHSKDFASIKDSIWKSMQGNSDASFSIPSQSKNLSRNRISVTGILDTQFGLEQTSKPSHAILLGGGILLEGRIKENLSFGATFISSNSSFPSYIDSTISNTNVVPGMGSAYSSKTGYSNQYYACYLSYSPNKIFNFQIGKDKHFFGDGYRSLFLSDVSNSYPFLKLTTTVWKIKYVSLYTWMKDVKVPSGLKKDFLNKYGTFHYLSWNATRRINFSLFEAIIWQGTDSNRVRNFDVNYLNPVIFFRPAEYSLGSSDNSFLGASFKVKIGSRQHKQFYGQIMLDEFLLSEVKAMNGWWANKQGVQFGFKNFNLFTIKNLSLQTEINAVRPYTYSHGSVQQNYANFNQPLAHPFGANFVESVTFLNYSYKKWMFETEFINAKYGKDQNGKNFGQNIFESYATHPNEYGNKFLQGMKTDFLYTKLKIAYYLIPSADLVAEAGVAIRKETNSVSSQTSNFVFIGIKTAILNRYKDF
jgi:hypothetical protein